MPLPTVVITGASGFLGRAVFAEFQSTGLWNVVGTALSRPNEEKGIVKCDLTDDASVKALLDTHNPQVIIHSAAERRPDVAAADPQAAEAINVGSVALIATEAKRRNTYVVYISTDYIFDGTQPPYTPDAAPNPLNDYGRLKLAGERAFRSIMGDETPASILRLPILYGPVERLDESAVSCLFLALHGPAAQEAPVMDHYAVRFPTSTEDVAKVLVRLATLRPSGTFHGSSSRPMTKYEMAVSMCTAVGVHTDHIGANPEAPTGTVLRPRDAQLDMHATHAALLHPTHFPVWPERSFEESIALILKPYL